MKRVKNGQQGADASNGQGWVDKAGFVAGGKARANKNLV